MRNSVGFMCVYPPTHPYHYSKMVRCVDFKDILQKGFKSPKNIRLYMIFDWLSVSFRYAVKLRDDLMFSLCCLSIQGLLCGSLSRELHLNGRILAGCKFIVMKFCLLNKEKAFSSVLAITHVYVVKLDIIVQRGIDGYDVHVRR